MAKIWFSSDTHFCHDRAFIYEPRGFSSVDEMNKAIVKRWNSVVAPDDTVYLLGDVMLNDNEAGLDYLKQLNGHIHIIRGNHDTNTRNKLYGTVETVYDWGQWSDMVKLDGYTFYISHYPTMTSNLDNGAPIKQHVINLYGHTHQQDNFYKDIPFMYHVGLDSHDCYPVELTQIIADIKAKVKECVDMLGEEDADARDQTFGLSLFSK